MKKKILVVDDFRDLAESTATLLSLLGYQTSIAHDGQQAVALAGAERFDVVLLDLQMPVLDGFGAAREIRRVMGTARPVLIAVSAMAPLSSDDHLKACGFDHCVTKPVELERILALIEGGVPA